MIRGGLPSSVSWQSMKCDNAVVTRSDYGNLAGAEA